jgi:hypothetical protein
MKKMKSGNGLLQAIQTINFKEVIYVTAEVWNEILPTTLSKSWKKKKKAWPNMQQVGNLDVEKSVKPEEVETTATADKMRNLQSHKGILKSGVAKWIATDDPTYCNTDLDDNETILSHP